LEPETVQRLAEKEKKWWPSHWNGTEEPKWKREFPTGRQGEEEDEKERL
jgi:hypothetical protein